MTNEEKFELCFNRATLIVKSYRKDAPCDPKNWYVSTTLIVMALVSAAISATGQYMSAQAQSDAAKYNAAVARNNASTALQQGTFDAEQIRQQNVRKIAAQRNAMAANGIDPNSGSAVDIQQDSAQQGEMNALMALYTGRTGAVSGMAQSRLQSMEASNAMTAGYLGVGSSILGGAASAAAYDANSKNPTFMK